MSGVLFQLDEPVQHNQLHVVVALLDDQVDVALGSGLEPGETTVNPTQSTPHSRYHQSRPVS